MLRALILLVLFPTLTFAQDFKGYRNTTLDAILEDWSGRTRNEQPGISLSPPDKMKFVVRLHGPPVACSNAALKVVLLMINMGGFLDQGHHYPLCLVSSEAMAGQYLRTFRTCWCLD